MRDVMLIEKPDQAGALLHPLRLELLKLTDEPRTCTDLAEVLGETPQRIYYHVKVLERAGVLEKVEERKVRAISEGYYRATARSFWLSPRLVGRIGGPRRARDQMSLGFLLALAEELQTDVGRLAETEREEAPTLGFTAQVRLARPADRTAFLTDIQNLIQSIAKKYGAVGPPSLQPKETSPETFRIIFACYPRPEERSAS
ncbi:MAG: helix-turn-helix transcriptional regulator [Candidatus Eisenbacteria bacterium]|uniref:Helix-turn-helix transcriptional regulator n=1 Tax=Eiseniibacteriota bacterium TaxID=2212470 RepID=A0A538TFL4_UNCEI|nr:MAG: helix-turn-helix transcriptional regulator [Candidatus Eisenbacteria bacterium]